MNYIKWALSVLIILGAGISGVVAEPASESRDEVKLVGLTKIHDGRYEELPRVVELNNEQRARLNKAVKAMEDALQKWQSQGGGIEKMQQLESQAKEARKKKQGTEAAKARREHQKLKKQYEKLVAEHDQVVLTAIGGEGAGMWAGHQLTKMFTEKLKSRKLTDEQMDIVKKVCQAAGSKYAAAKTPQQRSTIERKLRMQINKELRTLSRKKDQQDEEERKKARKEKKEKRAKREKRRSK